MRILKKIFLFAILVPILFIGASVKAETKGKVNVCATTDSGATTCANARSYLEDVQYVFHFGSECLYDNQTSSEHSTENSVKVFEGTGSWCIEVKDPSIDTTQLQGYNFNSLKITGQFDSNVPKDAIIRAQAISNIGSVDISIVDENARVISNAGIKICKTSNCSGGALYTGTGTYKNTSIPFGTYYLVIDAPSGYTGKLPIKFTLSSGAAKYTNSVELATAPVVENGIVRVCATTDSKATTCTNASSYLKGVKYKFYFGSCSSTNLSQTIFTENSSKNFNGTGNWCVEILDPSTDSNQLQGYNFNSLKITGQFDSSVIKDAIIMAQLVTTSGKVNVKIVDDAGKTEDKAKIKICKTKNCSDGTLYTGTGTYKNTSIPFGTYYLVVDVPDSYEEIEPIEFTLSSSKTEISKLIKLVTKTTEKDTISVCVTTDSSVTKCSQVDNTNSLSGVVYAFHYGKCLYTSDSSTMYTSDGTTKTWPVSSGDWCIEVADPTVYEGQIQGYKFTPVKITGQFGEGNRDVVIKASETSDTGALNIKVVDKNGKTLEKAVIKVCKTEDCKDGPLFSGNGTYEKSNISFGTYYLVIDVPTGYVKKNPVKFTLSSNNSDYVASIELDAQTAVPDTLSTASRLILICGIVGIIAGVYLVYNNAKKQEQV